MDLEFRAPSQLPKEKEALPMRVSIFSTLRAPSEGGRSSLLSVGALGQIFLVGDEARKARRSSTHQTQSLTDHLIKMG